MLRPSIPSRATRSPAAARMRSRERRPVVAGAAHIACTVYNTAYTGRGRSGMSRRWIRPLAWFALAAQAAFVAAWIVGGALQRRYSAAHSYVSALAAHGMRDPGVVIAAFVVIGFALAGLGAALRPVLPRCPAALIAATLFALAGAGF